MNELQKKIAYEAVAYIVQMSFSGDIGKDATNEEKLKQNAVNSAKAIKAGFAEIDSVTSLSS